MNAYLVLILIGVALSVVSVGLEILILEHID